MIFFSVFSMTYSKAHTLMFRCVSQEWPYFTTCFNIAELWDHAQFLTFTCFHNAIINLQVWLCSSNCWFLILWSKLSILTFPPFFHHLLLRINLNWLISLFLSKVSKVVSNLWTKSQFDLPIQVLSFGQQLMKLHQSSQFYDELEKDRYLNLVIFIYFSKLFSHVLCCKAWVIFHSLNWWTYFSNFRVSFWILEFGCLDQYFQS